MLKLQRIAEVAVVALGLALGVTGHLGDDMKMRSSCPQGETVTPLHDRSIGPPYHTIVQLEPHNWRDGRMTFNIHCDFSCIQNLVLKHIGILSNGLSAESGMTISGGRFHIINQRPRLAIPHKSISSAEGYENWKKCVKTSEWTRLPDLFNDPLGIFRLEALRMEKRPKCWKLFDKLLPEPKDRKYKPYHSKPSRPSAPDPSDPDPYEMVIQLLPPGGEGLSMQLEIQYERDFVQTLVLNEMGILSDELYKNLLLKTSDKMSAQIVIPGGTEEPPMKMGLGHLTYVPIKKCLGTTKWDLVDQETDANIRLLEAVNVKKYNKCLECLSKMLGGSESFSQTSQKKGKGIDNILYQDFPAESSNDYSQFDSPSESYALLSEESSASTSKA